MIGAGSARLAKFAVRNRSSRPSLWQVHLPGGVQENVVVGRYAEVVHQCEWGPHGPREHQPPVGVPLIARHAHHVVQSVREGGGTEADEPGRGVTSAVSGNIADHLL